MNHAPKALYPALVVAAISVTVFSALGIEALLDRAPLAYSANSSERSVNDFADVKANSNSPSSKSSRESNGNFADGLAKKSAQNSPISEFEDRGQRGEDTQKVAVAAACSNCGQVISIRRIETPGKGSGVGAVAGGVAGALLGHQIGGGHGRVAMTVIGGAGGAYAGNAVEKNMNKRISYQVRVRMQSGKVQTIYQREIPDVQAGDPVRIKQGRLLPA